MTKFKIDKGTRVRLTPKGAEIFSEKALGRRQAGTVIDERTRGDRVTVVQWDGMKTREVLDLVFLRVL